MLNQKNKQYLFAFLAIFILFFLHFLGFSSPSFLTETVNSWKEQNFSFLQKIAHPFSRFAEMWNLTARLEDLQYRYSETAAISIKVESLEKENQELRKILENSDRSYQQTIITAPVISFAQSFVAAGSQSGVKAGSAVLYKGTLLGLIDEVEDRQSSVRLLSNFFDSGILAETNVGTKGLLKGNGREIIFTEIPSDANLEIGQLVFTTAQANLEKGLLIGRVARILTENQASATKTAIIEQMLSFYETSLVEIK